MFLDLKWHDIPNTVAEACRAAAEQGVWMVNVHAAGGERMLAAARDALDQASTPGAGRPLLIAVTVLTSLDDADLPATGVHGSVADQVERLALLAGRRGAHSPPPPGRPPPRTGRPPHKANPGRAAGGGSHCERICGVSVL